MQLDNLARSNAKSKEEQKKRNRDFYMEEEETLSYAPGMRPVTLNRDKSLFKGFGETGLNSAKSIFDAQAVFKTYDK